MKQKISAKITLLPGEKTKWTAWFKRDKEQSNNGAFYLFYITIDIAILEYFVHIHWFLDPKTQTLSCFPLFSKMF